MLFVQKDRTYGKVNFPDINLKGVKGVLLDMITLFTIWILS